MNTEETKEEAKTEPAATESAPAPAPATESAATESTPAPALVTETAPAATEASAVPEISPLVEPAAPAPAETAPATEAPKAEDKA